ncbi:MAG TPA: exo-alpha-sialidase [Verrucomicrobiota bacterium]|nr:exo-alpha-sialidase [Verrucomicrobiota bacterium]HNU49920.1 exo-alpha-sialidase [Verrucomicrobiota bacterium]
MPFAHVLAAGLLPAVLLAAQAASPAIPGTVVHHSPAASGIYIGSPSIAVLDPRTYVVSHDEFGPQSTEHRRAVSHVYRSSDRGSTWQRTATLDGAFWSTLFLHRGSLYLLGTDKHHGNAVIRRSTDGGHTWSSPDDPRAGLLRNDGQYHGAPVPVLEHAGRLWRAMERRDPPVAWGVNYRAAVLSAPVDANLLDAASWTVTNFLPSNTNWNQGDFGAWLEGNVVLAPDGGLVNLLRVHTRSPDEKAALVRVAPDGRTLDFDPASGFVPFPGGAKKFTVRFDPSSRQYWALASIVLDRHRASNPSGIRNALALTASPDLRQWTVRCLLLYHPDTRHHGFQYADWQFDGDDLIAVVRTAYDDDAGGAHNHHDANFLTFHRVANFRRLNTADSVAPWP